MPVQINFAFAHVMCYRCIDAGIWDKPLEQACSICGEHRTFSWSSFDYKGSQNNVHKQLEIDDEILPTFVQWLLHFEQQHTAHLQGHKTYETICYAHNGKQANKKLHNSLDHSGSRYDHVFVFGEIIRSGGLTPELIRQGNALLEMRVKKNGIITANTFRDT